jgi:hypothetical protein
MAEAVLARLHGADRSDPVRDVEYLVALHRAVETGVQYGIEVFAVGLERAKPIPLDLVRQARVAARYRIPLETALGRFTKAKNHLTDMMLAEADELGVNDLSSVRDLISAQDAAFERLIDAAGKEYAQAAEARPSSPEAKRVELARRLLEAERVDPSPLGYELDGHHLGLFAGSAEARPLVGSLAKEIGCLSLILTPSSEELWAWLGSTRGPLDPESVRDWIARKGSPHLPIAIGEPKSGHEGWCLTHEQARSSLWVARASGGPLVEYAEVVMLVAARQDRVAMASLRDRYLIPLANTPKGGDLRAALRAYFENGRSKAAAAKALGVSRQTLDNRIKRAQKCFGKRLVDCEGALSAALTLEELGCFPDPPDSRP